MRERLLITITDYRGARHYTLRQVVKHYALALALALVSTLVAGGGLIYWLQGEVAELAQLRERTMEEYALLVEEYEGALQTVEQKDDMLTQMNNELGHIEVALGLQPTPGADINSRLDAASQTALEKVLMLQNVPSGWPIPDSAITSRFGYRTHPVTKKRAFHGGIDLRARKGTPVLATADGVVEWAAFHKSSGYGNLVMLHHNFGFKTSYGHLDSVAVKPGDFVRKGQLIGHSGNSGLSNGPHLHYEIRYIHRRLDPVAFIKWSLENYEGLFENEGHVKWDALAEAVRERLAIQGQRLSLRETNSAEN
ncbi:M23 family metallopeptidase [Alkalilimnicola sp. S0819]|uniref:M23 family metallopeptidase n=1 Tax=Alkalilimnicola sp. S0819 TaxID=2613922 RepID=UPI001261BBD9|nr:M23 family metallopeptidase [Alkalilimnicola sp. S0819]KAB7623694.1 M23 family metallopeptidase [Alkalilimnicola sp. S0819]MPQ16823.1 peptidoglycan DD-metalloendopeptidase family protein [Alkalilimnicola sp. S0819]